MICKSCHGVVAMPNSERCYCCAPVDELRAEVARLTTENDAAKARVAEMTRLVKAVRVEHIAGRVYGTLYGAPFSTRCFGATVTIAGTGPDADAARARDREIAHREDLALIAAVERWWGDTRKVLAQPDPASTEKEKTK